MNEKQEASSRSHGDAIRRPFVVVGMMLAMSVSFMPHASAQGGGEGDDGHDMLGHGWLHPENMSITHI